MAIKVTTLLAHNTDLIFDLSPTLGGNLDTNGFEIANSGLPVTISGNDYPADTGSAGQVLTTDGAGITSWADAGSGTVTSVGISTSGPGADSLTIADSPVTGSGTITVTPNVFTSTTAGVVPASGGGTLNFLRADGTWAIASGTESTQNVTTTYLILTSDYTIFANAVSSGFTVSLPATPSAGEIHNIKKTDQTRNIVVINGNGNNIDKYTTISINVPFTSIEVQWNSVTSTWQII